MSLYEDEIVHVELGFNKLIMTVSKDESDCHPDARFWLPWSNWNRLEFYLKLNRIEKVNDKKQLGILVAGGIVQLRQ